VLFSSSSDGQLNPAELRQALALAGFNTNTDLVEEITDEFDTNGDGMIDMDEFKIMLHVLYKGARRRGVFDNVKSWFVDNPYGVYGNDVLTDAEIDAYKQIFHDADESGDMLLDEAELQSLLVESGFMHQQREFVYDAMRTMDTSGDGAIDFGEFLEFMVKIKTNKAKKASALASLGLESLLTGGPEQAPPLPKVMEPGYFKVARYVPMLAPSFEKRWCEMSTDGKLLIAESRGAVMRMKEKGVAAGAASMNGRAYDRNHCTAIDLAYVDEIRTSPSGNASGCKFDLITLTDVWYFKSETREVCNAWIKELLVWREHCAFKHYALNRGLPFHDVGEKVKKSKKSRRNGDGFFSLFMPSPLLLGASSTAALPTKKERGATTNGSAARRKSRNSSGLRSREQSQSQALTGVARNLDGGNSFVGGSERRSAGSESGLGRKSRQSSDRAQRQSSEGGGQRRSLSEYSAATSRTSMTRSDGYSEDPGSETDVEEAEY
jgi:Ca2+-binding EF-hand superfamily protein